MTIELIELGASFCIHIRSVVMDVVVVDVVFLSPLIHLE